MPDYSHLSTDSFASRYVLAAHYLSACRHIAEVGGSRLYQFMFDRDERVFWNIDPAAEERSYHHRVGNYRVPVQDFNFGKIPHNGMDKNGMCLLGLELFDEEFGDGGEKALINVTDAIPEFDVVVVDYCADNGTAFHQADVIDNVMMFHKIPLAIDMQFRFRHDSKYLVPNRSFFKNRQFRVYAR